MVWLNERLVFILATHAGIRSLSRPFDHSQSWDQDEEKRTWILNQYKLETFARFKGVALEISFAVPPMFPALHINPGYPYKLTFLSEYLANWPAMFKAQSTTMNDFVRLLSRSPKVNELSVTICMMLVERRILALSDAIRGKTEEFTRKVLDALLESGQLEPLKALSNVKRFDLRLSFESFPQAPRHEEILQELGRIVEGNYLKIHET